MEKPYSISGAKEDKYVVRDLEDWFSDDEDKIVSKVNRDGRVVITIRSDETGFRRWESVAGMAIKSGTIVIE